MRMAKENEREKKLYIGNGLVFNYAAELKLLLTALLILCFLATLLLFVPSRFTISTSDFRLCPSTTPLHALSLSAVLSSSVSSLSPVPAPSPPSFEKDLVLDNGVIKRAFNPYGAAAYNFITMSAYRGGLHTFAIIGLASKPLHVYGKPTYCCEWVPERNSSERISGSVRKILPDWGYGRVYTAVVLNCTFSQPLNVENQGGRLILYASSSGSGDRNFNLTDRIEVLTELPGSLNTSLFTSKPKYDYFYCGSPLYGSISPQRVREWLAYHVRLFGERSHFVIYDAGGVHEEVLHVLKPWMELGYVTLHDIRDQERFDGYYHNQFMVVNDCLHRYKFMANWMFFFDVDEFVYVLPKNTLKSALNSLSKYSQFTFQQMSMSSKLCLSEDSGKTHRRWGFEKLVYRDAKTGIRRDCKYAVQPRNVYATGVHMSENLIGKNTYDTERLIKYYHFHGSIANRREPCRKLINSPAVVFENVSYVLDTTMRDLAGAVKRYELKRIGLRLQTTRQ